MHSRSILFRLAALAILFTPGESLGAKVVTFTMSGENKFCSAWDPANPAYLWYVLGFINGAKLYGSGDNLEGMDSGQILDYIGNYCRVHPEDQIDAAVEKLWDTHGGR